MTSQRWALLGVQFGYTATRQIGAQHGASAEVAEQLHTAYREMVNKLNDVSLSNGSLFSRGIPHPLANLPPERLQQVLTYQRQREGRQEGLGAPGLVGPPSASHPGMPAQPSQQQQQQQSRHSVSGLPGQQQQPGVAGGVPNPAAGVGVAQTLGPGQYLAPPQVNPPVPARPLQPSVHQQPVNTGPIPSAQLDLNRPPNMEVPEAAVVLMMQEKTTEIFRSNRAQNANASESTFRFHSFHSFVGMNGD